MLIESIQILSAKIVKKLVNTSFYELRVSQDICDRRKELKLTQKELAGRIGKERAYIAKIEKGETDMQLSSFIRIASALGLTLDIQPKSGDQ